MPTDDASHEIRYARHPAVLAASLGPGETALLDPKRESYFGLDGPGARIWELIETPRTLDEICAALLEEFEVDSVECRRDTLQHLAELVAKQLAVECSVAR